MNDTWPGYRIKRGKDGLHMAYFPEVGESYYVDRDDREFLKLDYFARHMIIGRILEGRGGAPRHYLLSLWPEDRPEGWEAL
jgi:hypothetical protein